MQQAALLRMQCLVQDLYVAPAAAAAVAMTIMQQTFPICLCAIDCCNFELQQIEIRHRKLQQQLGSTLLPDVRL